MLRNRDGEMIDVAELVAMEFSYLVRFGLRSATDPRVLNTLTVVHEALGVDTPSGVVTVICERRVRRARRRVGVRRVWHRATVAAAVWRAWPSGRARRPRRHAVPANDAAVRQCRRMLPEEVGHRSGPGSGAGSRAPVGQRDAARLVTPSSSSWPPPPPLGGAWSGSTWWLPGIANHAPPLAGHGVTTRPSTC